MNTMKSLTHASALTLHRRIWLDLHKATDISPCDVVIIKSRYVDFMIELGEELQYYEDERQDYPGAEWFVRLFRWHNLGYEAFVTYHKPTNRMKVEISETKKYNVVDTYQFTFVFYEALTELNSHALNLDSTIHEIAINTAEAARDVFDHRRHTRGQHWFIRLAYRINRSWFGRLFS